MEKQASRARAGGQAIGSYNYIGCSKVVARGGEDRERLGPPAWCTPEERVQLVLVKSTKWWWDGYGAVGLDIKRGGKGQEDTGRLSRVQSRTLAIGCGLMV
jgi:hypothetical protein